MNTETTGFFEAVWALVGVAGGYVVRLIFDRRKKNAEDKSAELEADTKAVELYERFASQLNPRIESLQNKIESLTEQVFALREENHTLKIENRELKVENEHLKTEINKMHSEIKELRNSIQP